MAIRWKIDKRAMLEIQSREMIFSPLSQARGLAVFLVFRALTSRIVRHYVQSGPELRSFISRTSLECGFTGRRWHKL